MKNNLNLLNTIIEIFEIYTNMDIFILFKNEKIK
jgi:hypothetical protein